ncbi:transposase [uncultured Desulfatiglans sp.]|uniref:Transposase n=1 Tax=Uncultured Desulfatiglans sp. TaxID=1748965 RepID=A0A653A191_UNCDX|nr:transposase [uncultured Desulfatiglans sp.]VBB48472.1 transposase [uncultured Desulfatiglans sp.]
MTKADPRAHWSKIMQAQAASGQTIKAFCAERKISIHQFYAWRRRLKAGIDQQQQTRAFLELVPAKHEEKALIRIHVGDQLWIEVPQGFHPPTLLSVIETLSRIGHGACLP